MRLAVANAARQCFQRLRASALCTTLRPAAAARRSSESAALLSASLAVAWGGSVAWSACEEPRPGGQSLDQEGAEALAAATTVLREAKYGFFTTLDDEAALQPRGRIVELQVDDGLAHVRICTNVATRKVQQLQKQQRVAVLVWHAESMSAVEIIGQARLLSHEEACAQWPGDEWLTFFPEGPQSKRYCGIEVSVQQLEVVSVGHQVALGEDPGDWHPPVRLLKQGILWKRQPPTNKHLQQLKIGDAIEGRNQKQPVAALGTMNPGKLESCQRCFAEWPEFSYDVQCISAPSGVSEQPMGLEETVLGAKNRAAAAKRSVPRASVGIGLESGLVLVDGQCIDFCACAIYDGKQHYVGLSSAWVLPPQVAATFQQKGYNEAFEAIGIPADDRGAGVLSQMSDGILSRPKQMKESIQMAVLQLRNRNLYGQGCKTPDGK